MSELKAGQKEALVFVAQAAIGGTDKLSNVTFGNLLWEVFALGREYEMGMR